METQPSSVSKLEYQSWMSIGIIFPAFVIIQWVFYLTKELGYAPYRGRGIAISFGLYIAMLAVIFLADYALARLGIRKTIRSALWASAFIGPYAGLAAWNTWGHPVWSQVAGVVGTVAAFGLIYLTFRRRYGD
jgi:hypothetical protein